MSAKRELKQERHALEIRADGKSPSVDVVKAAWRGESHELTLDRCELLTLLRRHDSIPRPQPDRLPARERKTAHDVVTSLGYRLDAVDLNVGSREEHVE